MSLATGRLLLNLSGADLLSIKVSNLVINLVVMPRFLDRWVNEVCSDSLMCGLMSGQIFWLLRLMEHHFLLTMCH